MNSVTYSLSRFRLWSGLALFLLIPLWSGCIVVVDPDDDYCDGYPEIGYEIPDITLVAHAERYVRALEADPAVFYHTGGEYMYYDASTSDRRIADVYIDDTILTVVPKRRGRIRISVEAEDDCGVYVETWFYVDVIPGGAAQ